MTVLLQVIGTILLVPVIRHIGPTNFLLKLSDPEVSESLQEHDICQHWLDIIICLHAHTLVNSTMGLSQNRVMTLPKMTISSVPSVNKHKIERE